MTTTFTPMWKGTEMPSRVGAAEFTSIAGWIAAGGSLLAHGVLNPFQIVFLGCHGTAHKISSCNADTPLSANWNFSCLTFDSAPS